MNSQISWRLGNREFIIVNRKAAMHYALCKRSKLAETKYIIMITWFSELFTLWQI